ncbi:hypothetical protein WJX84_000435 [Apatococcus fuscideae]|uniref:AP2/ERF domain-containing protein n=1 Tax=Apatococcus fuscideae TaxID=2026836 RepID=A0AAW1SZY8_9CHLO
MSSAPPGAGEAFDKVLSGFGEPLSLRGVPPSLQQSGLFRTYDAAADAAQSAFELAERLALGDPAGPGPTQAPCSSGFLQDLPLNISQGQLGLEPWTGQVQTLKSLEPSLSTSGPFTGNWRFRPASETGAPEPQSAPETLPEFSVVPHRLPPGRRTTEILLKAIKCLINFAARNQPQQANLLTAGVQHFPALSEALAAESFSQLASVSVPASGPLIQAFYPPADPGASASGVIRDKPAHKRTYSWIRQDSLESPRQQLRHSQPQQAPEQQQQQQQQQQQTLAARSPSGPPGQNLFNSLKRQPGSPCSSPFRGVSKHRLTQRWEASLWLSGKQLYLGGFEREEDAARAYDIAALACKGPMVATNFDASEYTKELEAVRGCSKEEMVAYVRRRSSAFSRGKSRFRGVSGHAGRWEARIGAFAGRKNVSFGIHDTEEKAARQYDRALIIEKGRAAKTNFPVIDYLEEVANYRSYLLEKCGTDQGPAVHAIASTQTLPFDPTNPEEGHEVKEPVKAKGGRPRSHTAAIIYAEQLRCALT